MTCLLVGGRRLRYTSGPRRAGRRTRPLPRPVAAAVTVTAEELGHLRLQRGLQDQPGAQPGDVLHHLGQIKVGDRRQAVDLGSDAVSG